MSLTAILLALLLLSMCHPGIARATQRTIQKWLGYAEVRFHDTPIASAEFAPSGRASTVQSTDEEAAILPREDKHTPRAAAPQQGASAAAEKLSAAINAAIGSESDSGGSRSSDSDDEGEGGEGEEVEGSVVVPVLSPVLVDGPGETRPLTVVYRLQVGRPSGKGAARYEHTRTHTHARTPGLAPFIACLGAWRMPNVPTPLPLC